MHIRCADLDSNLLAVEVHATHQFRPISVNGYMAGRSNKTDDRQLHSKAFTN